ncbi:putative RNA-directed DNA polymerase, eukaryota, reverse transcriptase zinc-binding domain protein [Tanacetum coccineum]
MWNFLCSFIHDHNGKVILFVDLNEVRDVSERFGSSFSSGDAAIFNSFIQDVGLLDLPMGGRMFTWMNKAGTKLSKIDRFLISEDVLDSHSDILVTILDKLWSDHNPILLHCKKIDFGPTPFRIFHSWFDRSDFEDVVKEAWANLPSGEVGSGSAFHCKLKGLKLHLKQWYSQIKSSECSRRRDITDSLRTIENLIDAGNVTDEDREHRIRKLHDLDNLKKLDSLDLLQKARIKWDVEGDENLKFFHGIINARRKYQSIQEKFNSHDTMMNFPSFTAERSLSITDRIYLESVVSLEEIRSAVWDCGSQKAPGPDGFSFLFVKKFWEFIKHDIQSFVVKFFDSSELPLCTNSAFITLIPKVPNPLFIKDYRPISLIGIQYKIIVKILANRLSKVIDSIISQEQSAFISGRQILDGPLILSEIIDWYKKRNKKLLLFKVDFEKAFDSVSWRYLDHVMCMLGFGVKWRNWIKSCLYSARSFILINGSPTLEFSLKRGLRQGDPLSPFLFIIIMEGLHIALRDAMAANLLHGVKLGPSNFRLSYLFYADDVIIVSEWDHRDMDNIICVLHVFYMASGLKININKSNLFGVGVSSDEVAIMAANSGAYPISLAKLSGWKAHLSSKGIFKAPDTVIKVMESLRASFFWGSNKDNKKIAWVKWSNILTSFDKGGLGVGSLKAFNVSLLYTWRWRLLKNPVALWVKVINSIHGVEAGMTPYGCKTNGLWAKIVGTINHLHSSGTVPFCSIKYKVGYGSLIHFWINTWAGDLPLRDRFNRLFHLEIYKDCLIQDRISNGSWSWDWIRPILSGRPSSNFVHMLDVIGSVEVSQDSDSCFWYLSNDGNFSVSSIRHHIDDLLLPSIASSTRWCKFIPRKVNIFMWRLSLDRLPHRFNLSSRGLDIHSIMCPTCNEHVEFLNHVFFSCDTASNVWRLIRIWSDSKIPVLLSYGDCDTWFIPWHTSKDSKDRAYVIFAATCWVLWRFRNCVTFGSQSMRKYDIFDNIHLFSFSWLNSKGKMN